MDEEEEDEWWLNDEWRSRLQVEQTSKGPNIILLPEYRASLAKRWRKTLIVTVLGRMVRDDALEMKLKKLWGEVEVIDIGSGFFLVKCISDASYDLALTGGHWLMFDHYISVQPWKEDFDPDNEKVSTVAAWVRVAKLPMDYYEKGILHVVGSQIGQVLEFDMNTMSRSKGKFARICVNLDLQKPLPPCILINDKEKKVEYEGLHLICFNCGKYGHNKEHCSEARRYREEGETNKGSDTDVSKVIEELNYGGWMVVQRPWRGRETLAWNRKGGIYRMRIATIMLTNQA
ncbi:uncharacterized protein LOC114745067 [Neltuma alba]|uniref:uncharacterized protein LOC114745067 n=1 Tax=Neltuma alba TaxID=207710 RepID=UPI0010A55108|nr:uncharacterized protein LOC114745067 [Prosopis alba]